MKIELNFDGHNVRGVIREVPASVRIDIHPHVKILNPPLPVLCSRFDQSSKIHSIVLQRECEIQFVSLGGLLRDPIRVHSDSHQMFEFDMFKRPQNIHCVKNGTPGGLMRDFCVIFGLHHERGEFVDFYFDRESRRPCILQVDHLASKIAAFAKDKLQIQPNGWGRVPVVLYEKQFDVPGTIRHFPDKNTRFDEYDDDMRALIRAILSKMRPTGLHPYLAYFAEVHCFPENKDKVVTKIYQDWGLNVNPGWYSFLANISNPGLFAQGLLDPEIARFISPKYLLCQKRIKAGPFLIPRFKVTIKKLPSNHVFYLEIQIEQTNGSWFSGYIQGMISEQIDNVPVMIQVSKGCAKHVYNCAGRVVNKQSGRANIRYKRPKNFYYMEINQNGMTPCHIELHEPVNCTYRKLNDRNSTLWTKVMALESLVRSQGAPDVKKFARFFSRYPLHSETNALMELMCSYLFQDKYLTKIIENPFGAQANPNYTRLSMIKFAVGLYKTSKSRRLKRQLLRVMSTYGVMFPPVANVFNQEMNRTNTFSQFVHVAICLLLTDIFEFDVDMTLYIKKGLKCYSREIDECGKQGHVLRSLVIKHKDKFAF